MKKVVFIILTACWMIIIFAFSAKPAGQSTDMSMSVGKTVGKIFVSEFGTWSRSEQAQFAEKVDYPVRKVAHGVEYAVLGILLMLMFHSYDLQGTRCGVLSFAVGAVYAATDELHQLFVPGRSCQFTDVLIDSGGVLCGIMIFLIILVVKKQKILDFSS